MYKSRTAFEGSSKQIPCTWLWNSALHSRGRKDGLKPCVLLEEQDTLQSFASLALPSARPGRDPSHEDGLLSSTQERGRPEGKLVLPSQDLSYQRRRQEGLHPVPSTHTLCFQGCSQGAEVQSTVAGRAQA